MSIFDTIGQLTGIAQTGLNLFKKPEQKGLKSLQQGITLQSDALMQSASSERVAANFNNQVARINSQRQLAAQARQTERNLSTYRATSAGKGFSSSSKTALMFMNEELSNFETLVQHEKIALQNEQAARTFQAEVRASGLESQAGQVQARGRRIKEEFKPSGISRGKQIFKGIQQLPGLIKQTQGLLGSDK